MTVWSVGRDWGDARRRSFLLGLAPALLVLMAITVAPGIYLFLTSLTPLNLTMPDTAWDFSAPHYNYLDLWEDPRFSHSVIVQTKLSVATVVLQLLVGLGFALLLNRGTAVRRFARSALLVPMVLPPIVVGIIWRVMFTVDISPLHRAAAWLGMPIKSIITDPGLALWAIVFVETWEWFPFTMLMVLAALQMIPDSPIEAAKIDGANDWQIFRHITFPYIQQTLIVAGLFRLIDSIKAFPLIFVLTDGGPGDVTEVTNYYAYRQAFTFSLWGYGSAIATLMVVGIFVLSWIIDRLTRAVHAEAG
jgi:multiple sugar transport system permease protein